MGVDIGTQIVVVLAFSIMALFTRRNFPELSRYFSYGIIMLIALFSLVDLNDALSFIK